MLPIGHSVRIGLATKQHSKTDKKLSDMCYRTMGYDFDSAINQPEKIITKELQNYSSSNSSKLDKYQQIFKTETARATGNHLKASVKVLLAEQKHQSFLQVLHDNQVTLAGRKSFFTINIRTQPSSLQINCSNCYSRNPKIKKNDRENYRWCRWNQKYTSRGRSSNNGKSNDFAGKSLLAGIPTCHIQTNITNATGIDKNNFRHQENLYNVCMERSFAYLTLCISNIARSVVPVTMSAAILSSLSTTLGAGYQYMAQHYKQYSQSFSFYAASSVILMLCYLTTPSAAAATQSETVAIDKHPIFDESSSDKEILDLLLEKKRYDKRLLPPVNDEDFCCGLQSPDMATIHNERRAHNRGTLTVNVNVLLLSLASPDESSLKYEVEFLLNQQWNDPRLQYGNKSHYDFLNALHHHDSIWTPDTYFIMHGDFKDPIIPMHFALRIFRNGTITYAMRRHLILSCQGSLHIFPFDDPKCSFSMESISYEEAQIKYVWKNDEDTLRKSPSLTTLNAYLIKNQTTACDQNSWRGNYSCLQVEMTFTRDRAYYFTTVFIPGIILVTSSFITFWLEWNAVPARVMIGVTTMLNFFTTSNGFRSTLPVVSNLTAMNVWDGVCMCFIYASLLEFVCVNYVGRKRPLHNVVYRPGENPVTQRLPAVLSRIGVILASPLPGEKRRDAGAPNEIVACTTCGSSNSPCTHSVNNGCATETCFVQMRKKEPPHPIRVAKTIDVIARITFPTAYATFLIFFFVHYKGFS
ncbi:glutamate-gated chloride channel isoform X20 [Drosophila mojavensis]|uniref:glutamate-gated chloride channel isoform X20 n=1 Tax=Drosophila mojavensis TaxID=7230 RepID=UPI0013EEB4D2|nr:glutamate-gated chloride channel isoform X20 [Drosophila mojavensis]